MVATGSRPGSFFLVAVARYHYRVVIAKIGGILESVQDGGVLVRTDGGLTYEVLMPAYTVARLGESLGSPIELHTLYFIEGQAQGTTMSPRLAGFLTPEDRRFFELFITCKGIGNRRALRAMALETAQIAAAIVDRDATMLQSLPEIGKRTAETIIATLRGKVDGFASSRSYGTASDRGEDVAGDGATATGSGAMAREALEVLLSLGESRAQCVVWIDKVLWNEEKPADTQELISRVYGIKSGSVGLSNRTG